MGQRIKDINNHRAGKRLYMVTFGCQMNVKDSELIAGLLTQDGYALTDEPSEADVVIFNTCAVRQHAEDKVWSQLGRIRSIKKGKNLRPIIGLVGCMAKNYGQEVFARAPEVDFVVGPSDIQRIPQLLRQLEEDKTLDAAGRLYRRKIWYVNGETRPEEIYQANFFSSLSSAYVIISEGCSNYCSYCVVPYTRGPLRHRHYQHILSEIEQAVARGINQITLLGQNVNAYYCEGVDFVQLLYKITQIKGLKELSFITSHPKDTSRELFQAMASLPVLKRYLHLPVQSASDRILHLMNRNYTRSHYLKLVEDYRRTVKDGVLTTDIIVGFPSETQEDFEQTYNLVREVEFDAAYIFKYSPRPNTKSAHLPDDVPLTEKERRHKMILELQKQISRKKSRKDGLPDLS